MAVTLTNLQMVLRLVGTLNGGADLSALTDVLSKNYTLSYTNGTGASQANMWWHDQRTVGASANENLDFSNATAGMFGATLVFTALKAILVVASTGNTNSVQLTRPAANSFPLFMAANDGISLAPGEVFLWMSPTAGGKAVTDGTGDLLTVTNSGGGTSVVYDAFILGIV